MEKMNSPQNLGGDGLFNSLTEIGMRILVILDAFYPRPIELKYLSLYDYYVVYTEDLGGPENLHVPTASRSGEYLVRRKGIQHALTFLVRTHLVDLKVDANGQAYQITEEATGLLDVVGTSYHEKLKQRAAWIYQCHTTQSPEFDDWMLRKLSEENSRNQNQA